MSSASAFWSFSLSFYARDGVPAACLALQDKAGVDINCLFLLIYLSFSGRLLNEPLVAAIHDRTQPWREQVVVPLRGVRRHLKTETALDAAHDMLRSNVKRLELEAERLQQLRLEAAFPITTTGSTALPAAALQRNLELFERYAGPLPPEAFARLRANAESELGRPR